MMRRIIMVVVVGLLLTSCGANKRSKYGNRIKTDHKGHDKHRNTNNVKEDKTMPDFGKKFVKFNITSVDEYIRTFSELAQDEMKAYGIPASITLAQGILESGAGKGKLAQKTNNHFGIKCHKGWYGDSVLYDDDEKDECFRKYVHPMLSFRDHSLFLSRRARYAFLFEYKSNDYKKWAKGLRQAGYATDKRYPQKLISLIERYELYKYDGKGMSHENPVQIENKNRDLTTHIVKQGETLYAISRQYYVSISELMKLNKMTDTILSIGQELIVKIKK